MAVAGASGTSGLTIPPVRPPTVPAGKNPERWLSTKCSAARSARALAIGTDWTAGVTSAPASAAEDYFYNGFKRSEFGPNPKAFEKLGVEKRRRFFHGAASCSSIAPRQRKVERLPSTATPSASAELQSCLEAAALKIHEGDGCVHTAPVTARLWMKDKQGCLTPANPGIGMDAARWLTGAKNNPGSAPTNWAIEVVPHEDKQLNFPVHEWIITRNGTYKACEESGPGRNWPPTKGDRISPSSSRRSASKGRGPVSPGNRIAVR